MDWFSWLSKTGLELTLVYDYGVMFACNELTAEDIAHFDHEFLQSMGIKVAKHRLEIIKLARSEAAARGKGGVSSRVWDAIERTKRRVVVLVECARRVMSQEGSSKMVVKWKGGQQEKQKEKEEGTKDQHVFMLTDNSHKNNQGHWGVGFRSSRMKSGPLERTGQPRAKGLGRGHSGPLDKVGIGRGASVPGGYASMKSPLAPRTPPNYRSPMVSGPVDGEDGIDSLWAKLFQDMKPT